MIRTAQATPVITAGAYSAANAVGATLTFSDLLGKGSGKITSITITDKSGQKPALDVILFNVTPATAQTDKTAVAIAAGDLAKAIGVVSFVTGDFILGAVSTNAIATKANLQVGYATNSSGLGPDLFVQLVARGTPTFVSTSDLVVRISAEVQD